MWEVLTLSVPEALVPESPVNSLVVDVSSPAVVDIVFELAFVNEVVDLSPEPLHLAVSVDLAECAPEVVA